jgi:glycosyltransferase involved in cell wall biosynthesis
LNPLRIAFIDSWLQNVADGSGTAAAIGGLGRALQARGHHVRRIAPLSNWPANLTARRIWFNLSVPALMRSLHYDLIVGFDIDGVLVAGSSGPTPYICSIKGVIAEELLHERGAVRARLWLLSRIERLNARRAPLVLTTSAYCRRAISKHYGIVETRIRVVPEGIDLPRWRERLASHQAITPDDRLILCVARQYPRKRIADLIEAFAIVRRKVPDARLAIIGDGPEHANLRSMIVELNLEEAAQLLGAIPADNDVAAWYRRATIFCLPSVQEGFGIVFLEAMAAGLPIVATTATAIPEVVPDGLVGTLVPPGDVAALAEALTTLLLRPNLRAAYAGYGQAYVERYDWDRVAEMFLAAVHEQPRL